MTLEALADPARLRIVRHLQAHPQSTLRELALAAGVHPNTARPHVTALVEAGVLAAATAPCPRPGRPPLRYRLVESPNPIERALGGMGFEVHLDGEMLHLRSCPCPRLVPDKPNLICDLALAVAEGLAGDVHITERTHDPEARRCSARLMPARRRRTTR